MSMITLQDDSGKYVILDCNKECVIICNEEDNGEFSITIENNATKFIPISLIYKNLNEGLLIYSQLCDMLDANLIFEIRNKKPIPELRDDRHGIVGF